ncbi:putative amidase family protein [Botrytis fragariae]|uniref:Putative amidase family protein n=1 Tax=Botrytis fragariae TaxID=1964551 RepID=A0A8H6B2W0_9HELO|nr:putative amidase family protein [Botrytis fragariae]KAF5878209.1 putative amidase family protein [Botrytis fragariae]
MIIITRVHILRNSVIANSSIEICFTFISLYPRVKIHSLTMESFTAQSDSTTIPNVLTATAGALRKLLQGGKVSSVQLVDLYLSQIERHNHRGLKLNAMISTAPKKILLDIAKSLDDERAAWHTRGPFHGIPVTVKDSICTDVSLGMDTACGSYALVGSIPQHNAPIMDHLLKAGMIVIGKANLSIGALPCPEMSGWKGFGIITGWSAVGQTQSPYIVGGLFKGEKLLEQTAPAGSSSGSASEVATGFAPLAIATETDESITQPANRASLFGIKVIRGSCIDRSIGGMAKSTQDLAYLVDVILGTNIAPTLNTSWKGQTVGFVDNTLWGFSEFICTPDPVLITQQREAYMDTKKKLIEHGATFHENIPLTSVDELQIDGDDALDQLWNHDYAEAWEKFLKNFPRSSMKSIADIVKFNKLNAKVALPAAKTNGIYKTIHQFGLDVIVGPMDGRIPTIAAAAGYPVGTVPLGYSQSNERPVRLAVVVLANKEHKILQFMTAWDKFTPSR